MAWDGQRYVNVLPDPCTGCGQHVLPTDRLGRCADCALYDEMGWTNEARDQLDLRGEQDNLRIEGDRDARSV